MQPSLPPLMAFADSSLKDTLVGLNFLRPTERKRLALLSAPLTQAFSDGGVLGALPPLSQTTLKGGRVVPAGGDPGGSQQCEPAARGQLGSSVASSEAAPVWGNRVPSPALGDLVGGEGGP